MIMTDRWDRIEVETCHEPGDPDFIPRQPVLAQFLTAVGESHGKQSYAMILRGLKNMGEVFAIGAASSHGFYHISLVPDHEPDAIDYGRRFVARGNELATITRH